MGWLRHGGRRAVSTRCGTRNRAIAKIRTCLPPPHHDATVVWQLTASAGKKADELRAHLWFLLDTPLLGRQIAAWCKPAHDAGWLDPTTLTNEVVPIPQGIRPSRRTDAAAAVGAH